MAISSSMVWEVRGAGGSDANGGGFAAGSTGTDYSQQATAQVAVTDAVANGSTTITSATAGFSSAHVGNVVFLSGGTGPLAGTRRQILSVTDSATIVVDSAVASGTGLALNLGGSLATLTTLAGAMVASNKAFIRADAYVLPAAVTFGQTAGVPSNLIAPTRLFGYSATRGDITLATAAGAARPVFTYNGPANAAALTFSGAGWEIGGLAFVNGTTRFGAALSATSTDFVVWGCKFIGGGSGFTLSLTGGSNSILGCEVGNSTGGSGAILTGANSLIRGCWIHDGVGDGVRGTPICLGNVISNMTGSGLNLTGAYPQAASNTIYKSGSHGIQFTVARYGTTSVIGNILSENGGYGLSCAGGAGMAASPLWDGNAYYANALGRRFQLDGGPVNGVIPADSSMPYANPYDLNLTVDPFVAKASNDFRLNAVAGGGANCRKAAPLIYGVGGFVGYQDMGAIQHQDNGAIPTGGVSKSRLIGGA